MSTTSQAPPPRRPTGRPVRLDSLKNPQPRPPPQLNKKPSRAQRVAASNDCPNPNCHDKDVGEEDGQLVCRGCGTVVSDSNMVSEVTFGVLASGGHILQGTHVGADQTHGRSAGGGRGRQGDGMNSRDVTESQGKGYVNQLGAALTISQSLVDSGMQIFKLAAANNFIQGRRIKSVAAVCLYIACRIQKDTNRVMLIDFSDVLQLDVFKLGRIYKDLIDELRINGNGFTIHPINPEDLILRFAYRLEFGKDTMRVANEAVRIVQRMNRDWMTPGRRPAGICGAALVLAARMNNYRRSVREMVYIVKVTESTISKRLEEFKETESSGLTVEEFRTIDLERACDPPSFAEQNHKKKKGRKRKLIEVDDGDSSGDELRRARSLAPTNGANVQQHAHADSQSMPPPPIPIDPNLLQASASSGAQSSSNTSTTSSMRSSPSKRRRGAQRRTSTPEPNLNPESDLTSLINPPTTFSSATALQRALSSTTEETSTEPPQPTKPRPPVSNEPEISDSEFASDSEVMNCMLTPSEHEIKERIWTHDNTDWLRDQNSKRVKEQIDEANGTTRVIVKRTRRRARMGDVRSYRSGDEDGEDGPVANTPGEAAMKMLKKRGYSKKINYEALKKLYEPSTPSRAATPSPDPNTHSTASSTAANSRHPSRSPSPTSSTMEAPSAGSVPKTAAKPSRPIPPAPSKIIPSKSAAPPPPSKTLLTLIKTSALSPPIKTLPPSKPLPTPSKSAMAHGDDEHEEGDPDFWYEGELERVQGEIEDRLDDEEDDDEVEEEEEEEEEYMGDEYD